MKRTPVLVSMILVFLAITTMSFVNPGPVQPNSAPVSGGQLVTIRFAISGTPTADFIITFRGTKSAYTSPLTNGGSCQVPSGTYLVTISRGGPMSTCEFIAGGETVITQTGTGAQFFNFDVITSEQGYFDVDVL